MVRHLVIMKSKSLDFKRNFKTQAIYRTDDNVKKFLFKMRQVVFFFFYTNPLFSDISFRGCLSRNENQCCLAYSEEQICNSNFNPPSKYQKYHVFSCRYM